MMKKLLSWILVLVMVVSTVACGGGKSDEPVINEESQTEQETSEDSEDTDEGKVYSNKIFYIGEDIPEGTYIIKCTKADHSMETIIFKSESQYKAFQEADRFTVGEYRTAVEQNSWANYYVYEDETVYIGLESGNIILLDGGMCEFNKHDAMTENVLHSGIYVAGKDINADNLDINCITEDLKVVVFENAEKYLEYHKTSRSTVGEEEDAIGANSLSCDYLNKDEITSVNLKDGMILMIENGIGEYLVSEGPIIN